MKTLPHLLLAFVLAFVFVATALTQSLGLGVTGKFTTLSLNLTPLFNNPAASPGPDGTTSANAHGGSFDSRYLPPGPEWVYDGIPCVFPTSWGPSPSPPTLTGTVHVNDNANVIAAGQLLVLDEPTFVHELHMIYAGDASGSTHECVTFMLNFAYNTTQGLQLSATNWWRWPILNWGVIRTPYSYQSSNLAGTTGAPIPKNFNQSQIYQWSSAVPSESKLASLTLPPLNTARTRRLHLFAVSVLLAAAAEVEVKVANATSNSLEPALAIRGARFTNRWDIINGERAQAVAITLANVLPTAARSGAITSAHTIEVSGGGITTVQRGVVKRPGNARTSQEHAGQSFKQNEHQHPGARAPKPSAICKPTSLAIDRTMGPAWSRAKNTHHGATLDWPCFPHTGLESPPNSQSLAVSCLFA